MKPRIGLAVLFPLAFAALACDFGDPFAEYRGVNLLPTEAQEFSFTGDQTDWAWQPYVYDPTADADDPATENVGLVLDALDPGDPRAHLLVFEDAAADGGPGAARLEIPNLMPNGDFEATADGAVPADWNPDGFNEFEVQEIPGANYQINQKVLRIQSDNISDAATFQLTNLAGSRPPNGSRLFIRYRIRSSGSPTNRLQLRNSDDSAQQILNAGGLPASESPLEFPADYFAIDIAGTSISSTFAVSADLGDAPILALPAGILADQGTLMDAAIDDLRIGRSDTGSYIHTQVPLSAADGQRLLSGTYRLSLEVRRDPTADLNDVNKTANRFPAPRIAAEVFPAGSSFGLNPVGRKLPDWEDAGEWTRLSFTFSNLQIPQGIDDEDPAIEIRIYANDNSNEERTSDIGSILIRRPRLEFIP
ncbi:hypothetical protein [Spirochaeta africana]|uniref:Lipoprotein n=1 Tax=Spirochaeta africana (strain ATCC 700263 / DSM 8902 / Z-7692) TaxID=889378 RepID=H9UMA0_SPIAZ|nr:hypothetical protein [Spirochaeta africana]AFG38643.1 hypothetical protein Spiaf_2617 [Spirochaeta africana DSM 8902]